MWRMAAKILRWRPRAAGWAPAARLAVSCWGGPRRQAERLASEIPLAGPREGPLASKIPLAGPREGPALAGW